MFVPFGAAQTSVTEFYASSSASTGYLAKTKAIYILLTTATAFSGHAKQKLGNSNVLHRNKKNPVELKRCKMSSSCRVFYLMKLKPRKEG